MNKYTIFWLTGKTQVIEGDNPHEAMNNANIRGSIKLRAMDFYSEGDKREDFYWDKKNRTWRNKYLLDTVNGFSLIARN